MKIASSSLHLSSQRVASKAHEQRESLQIWRDGGNNETQQSQDSTGLRQMAAVAMQHMERTDITSISISRQAAELQPHKTEVSGDEASQMTPQDKLEYSILKLLVERLTGKEVSVYRPEEVVDQKNIEAIKQPAPEGSSRDSERAGWGLRYDYYEHHQESEHTAFHAEGVVRTKDGKEIEIDIELLMSREFQSTETLSIRAGDALKDPLDRKSVV